MSNKSVFRSAAFILIMSLLPGNSSSSQNLPQPEERKTVDDQFGPLTSKEIAALWTDLDSPDGVRAGNAINALSALPTKVLPIIETHLHSLQPAEPAKISRWVNDLDHDGFKEREKATRELEKLGDLAEPALQGVLLKSNSVEARHRATQLLVALDAPSRHPGKLQKLRMVPLLEQIDTAQAREFLRRIANLPTEDQRSQDAKSALKRLAQRKADDAEQLTKPRLTNIADQSVIIDDVSKHLKDPNAPVRKGILEFRVLHLLQTEAGKISIVATYGRSYGNFELGYVLRARIDVANLTKKELSLDDLSEAEISYTDDQLEMQRMGERDVEGLIQLLYRPQNKASCYCVLSPGGEMFNFSDPMRKLIVLGDKARYRLEQCLADPRIQDEVALVLGAIGSERSVTLLVDAYPPIGQTHRLEFNEYSRKVMVFSFALPYLTGRKIGRDRSGADYSSENRKLWTEWWAKEKGSFKVPSEKPQSTWVPSYPSPNLSADRASYARKQFTTDYSFLGVNRP